MFSVPQMTGGVIQPGRLAWIALLLLHTKILLDRPTCAAPHPFPLSRILNNRCQYSHIRA